MVRVEEVRVVVEGLEEAEREAVKAEEAREEDGVAAA